MNDAHDSGADRLLLTPTEAADVLGIGRTKVFALIATGELKSIKIGRSRRVPIAACHEFVESLRGE
jgi:excisionase family DNA binding protein